MLRLQSQIARLRKKKNSLQCKLNAYILIYSNNLPILLLIFRIYTFSEKVQNKLFTASNAIIKSTLQKKIGENKRDRKSGLCKMQEADLHCVVDKTGYVKQVKQII